MIQRARGVKPGIFTHWLLWHVGQRISQPLVAYCFIGIWTCCDRRGRFDWKADELKVRIAPYHANLNFEHVLNALANAGFIVKYRVGAKHYGWIPSFTDHQHLNGRESDSNRPLPPSGALPWHEERLLLGGFEALTPEDLTAPPHEFVVAQRVTDASPTRGARVADAWSTREAHGNPKREREREREREEELTSGADKPPADANQVALAVPAPPANLPPIVGQHTVQALTVRLARVLDDVSNGAHAGFAKDQLHRLAAGMVFSYWAMTMGHEKSIFDGKRERRLLARLKENGGDVGELLYAVDGAKRDDYLMGRDPKSDGRVYDGIETIFRDRSQVERLAATTKGFREGRVHKLLDKYGDALRGIREAGDEPT